MDNSMLGIRLGPQQEKKKKKRGRGKFYKAGDNGHSEKVEALNGKLKRHKT